MTETLLMLETAKKTRVALAVGWSAALIGGALFLKLLHPERWLPLIGRLGARESVHVVAHVFLYGTLAALVRGLSRRSWVPIAVVALVGLLQEVCQTVAFGKRMGWPEAFDVAVDFAAAVTVVLLLRWLQRRRHGRRPDAATAASDPGSGTSRTSA